MTMDAERDRLTVQLLTPPGGPGGIYLNVDMPVMCSTADRTFALDAIAAVTDYARVALAPGALAELDEQITFLAGQWESTAADLEKEAAGDADNDVAAARAEVWRVAASRLATIRAAR